MKTYVLSLIFMSVTAVYTPAQIVISTASAQETGAIQPTQGGANIIPTGTGEYTPVSHWSLGIKGGANYFRISPQPIKRLDQVHLMYGGTLEYSINPLVGLGIEYNYNPYGRPYYTDVTTGKLEGGTQDALLYGSINLSNLLAPYRAGSNSKWNVFAEGGVGYSNYNINMDDEPITFHQGPMGKVGLNIEHNFHKSWAFGIEGQYRFYHRKFINSNTKGDALTTTIGLRYKFGAHGDKKHARNISMSEYYPKPAPVIIDNTIETMDRLKALEVANAVLNDKIDKLNEVILALSTKSHGDVTLSFQNIEFEFGSDILTRISYSILDQMAANLKNKPASVKVNIVGHTDYIGTKEFNKILSLKRANAVKDYLIVQNVPVSSIFINGFGENDPITSNKTKEGRQKNRRVEFQISI